MNEKLQQLRGKVHLIACDARMLSRTIDSAAFARAWELATEAQRVELDRFISTLAKDSVDQWVKKVLAGVNLADKSHRDLRDLARAAGVMYYNNKSKEELLKELEQ